MGITLPEGDSAATARARRVLRAFDQGPEPPLALDRKTGTRALAPPPTPSAPIPIYAPPLGDAPSLAAAAQTGWRYLVTNSDRVGAIDVGTGKRARPELVCDASLAERLARAVRIAVRRVEGEGDYELRLLDLSLVGDSLIWLASRAGADRFFTYAEMPEEVAAADVAETIRKGARALDAVRRSADPEAGG